jgi:hypothetical protein
MFMPAVRAVCAATNTPDQMPSSPQKPRDPETQALRRSCGKWLQAAREQRGLSQRDVAHRLGVGNYTFVSQLELGTRRLPPGRYQHYAEILAMDSRAFTQAMLEFYDPHLHRLLFGAEA